MDDLKRLYIKAKNEAMIKMIKSNSKNEAAILNDRKIAKMAGVNYDTLKKILTGDKSISVKNVIKIFKALGCELSFTFKN